MSYSITRSRILAAMGLAPVALVACTVASPPQPDAAPPVDRIDALFASHAGPPADGLEFVTSDAVIGRKLRVGVRGARPGANLRLAAGESAGATCPEALEGGCVEISRAKMAATATADADGRASMKIRVPADVRPGTLVHLQLVARSGGEMRVSELVRTPATLPDCVVDRRATRNLEFTDVDAGETFMVCEAAAGRCAPAEALTADMAQAMLEAAIDHWIEPGLAVAATCQETVGVPDHRCCWAMAVSDPLAMDTGADSGSTVADSGGWTTTDGRPFVVGGQAHSAATGRGEGWASCDGHSALDPNLCQALVAAWSDAAEGEHASIASFARFTLQLLELGAPAELVADATRAQADEIAHARDALALASRFAGHPLAPGALSMDGALAQVAPAEVLRAAILEGCVNETVCLLRASAARDAATDPQVRRVLTAVVEDETRHAELSWAFVRWMLDTHPDLQPVAEAAFAEGLARPIPTAVRDPRADDLRPYGVLPADEAVAAAERALAEVVLPCARALFSRVAA